MSETNVQLFPGVFRSVQGGANPDFFLHSAGRVGIGNQAPSTPPAWDANTTFKLNVTGHTHINGNLDVGGSVYGDGSNLTGTALPWQQSTPNLATDIKYEGGNVGIGGAAVAGAKLNVNGSIRGAYNSDTTSYFGRAAIGYTGHDDHASFSHVDRSTTGNYALLQSSSGFTYLNCTSGQSIAFRVNNSDKMRMNSSGYLGIGTTSPLTPLHIASYGSNSNFLVRDPNNNNSTQFKLTYFDFTDLNSDLRGSSALPTYNGTGGGSLSLGATSIFAQGHVITRLFFIASNGMLQSSDERIKESIKDVNDEDALNIIRLLKPKKYKYIDYPYDNEVWGFIAQEVLSVLPEACRITTNVIPNIYEVCEVELPDIIKFQTFNTSNLESGSMTIEMKIPESESNILKADIVEILDEHRIRIDTDLTEYVFTRENDSTKFIRVYGQEVKDFHTLKKDSIWTVATAALQEVDRQLQAEKEKVKSLEERLAALEAIVLNQ